MASKKRTSSKPHSNEKLLAGRSFLSTTRISEEQQATRSRHVIHIGRNVEGRPIITSSLYPLSKTRASNLEIQTENSDSRSDSELSSNNRHRFMDSMATAETARHFSSAHGVIETSFSHAGHKAGLSDDLIEEIAKIFAWDIDFASNLRKGDQFTVVYQEKPAYAQNGNNGQIIAAEIATMGKIFTAVRYKDHSGSIGYYTPEGKGMQKAFLSAPVDYARISSHYDSHRKHPVLNRIRAHKGVDYAARTGTPVKSAGDGEIMFRGRKGGYGQVLIVKHGEHYETVYAHLSNFKKGLQSGDIVKQGEVIGYVGQTGLATGPHLHYEFRIDGVHHNPESLNHKHSLPLSGHLMAEFKAQTRPYLAQLYQVKSRNLLAKNL